MQSDSSGIIVNMGEAANIVLESAEAVAKGLNKKEKGILGVQWGLLGFLG